jgi:transposase
VPIPAELRKERNRGLLGAGIGGYRNLAIQKALAAGCVAVKDDPHRKTSATCGTCGAEGPPVPLWVDEWTCQQCGSINDRRANSAEVERRNAVRALAGLGSPGGDPQSLVEGTTA